MAYPDWWTLRGHLAQNMGADQRWPFQAQWLSPGTGPTALADWRLWSSHVCWLFQWFKWCLVLGRSMVWNLWNHQDVSAGKWVQREGVEQKMEVLPGELCIRLAIVLSSLMAACFNFTAWLPWHFWRHHLGQHGRWTTGMETRATIRFRT